jgi:alpha,alpha-trehalose-phosphate synthase [UDP-forming]
MARRSRIIIVSNRLPVNRVGSGPGARWETSAGGLVSAMTPVLEQHRGVWVGWTGSAGERGPTRAFRHEGVVIRPVTLTAHEVEHYYDGMSNRTLWPLYHDAIRTPEFHRAWWRSYVKVNYRFAHTVSRLARPGDLVWVHDFHLQLVPRMLRQMRPELRIGFFLHIPFPPEELFAWLPWDRAIVEGLLGADVVGFQTAAGAQNFARLARQHDLAEGAGGELRHEGRTVRVQSYPISIDFGRFEALAQRPEVMARAAEIRRRIGSSRKIMLAVDRLDYTKGIDSRLHAFGEMLAAGRTSVDRCCLVQIAVPSREIVSEYQAMRTTVEQTVGRINGEYSQPGRVAVHYFRRSVPREELVAWYRAADVMMVTPLRDGMNLVCKEYVACRVDGSGVLVLSEFAGAARELRRALLVNPRDADQMAATMEMALRLPREEARQRMAILRMIVRRHDVHEWASNFLAALAG